MNEFLNVEKIESIIDEVVEPDIPFQEKVTNTGEAAERIVDFYEDRLWKRNTEDFDFESMGVEEEARMGSIPGYIEGMLRACDRETLLEIIDFLISQDDFYQARFEESGKDMLVLENDLLRLIVQVMSEEEIDRVDDILGDWHEV